LFDRGVTLDSLGRLDEAVGDYSAVLMLTPFASNALNNRANVYRRQGRLDDARRDYLAALAGNDVHPQYPYYGLGQIAEANGDAAAARDYYAKALAADPGYRLAADRLQALGAADWTSADPGVIVLRPPPAPTPIVLRPPPPKSASQTAQTAAGEQPGTAPSPPFPPASPKPGAGDRRQAPLRPAIVEGRGKAGATTQGPLAQLGAWRSEAEAQAGWEQAQGQAGGLLDGLTPHIVAADLPERGRYYRLQVVPGTAAPQFCAALVAKGLACFPVRD
jgi:tetratricopeptide (TPR) repeat protein